jgi:hypothetical protein
VAYSGFHVVSGAGGTSPFADTTFSNSCGGDLTPQEKVLLYMLFDLGACVGATPIAPSASPPPAPRSQSNADRPQTAVATS